MNGDGGGGGGDKFTAAGIWGKQRTLDFKESSQQQKGHFALNIEIK